MTKDKSFIEKLLRNFRKYKARISVIELGIFNDDEDDILNGIDYSSDNVQTSNISTLDSFIIRREKEKEMLLGYVALAKIFMDSLKEKDRILVEAYYIEGKSQTQVASIIGVDEVSTVWRRREKVLAELMEIM